MIQMKSNHFEGSHLRPLALGRRPDHKTWIIFCLIIFIPLRLGYNWPSIGGGEQFPKHPGNTQKKKRRKSLKINETCLWKISIEFWQFLINFSIHFSKFFEEYSYNWEISRLTIIRIFACHWKSFFRNSVDPQLLKFFEFFNAKIFQVSQIFPCRSALLSYQANISRNTFLATKSHQLIFEQFQQPPNHNN